MSAEAAAAPEVAPTETPEVPETEIDIIDSPAVEEEYEDDEPEEDEGEEDEPEDYAEAEESEVSEKKTPAKTEKPAKSETSEKEEPEPEELSAEELAKISKRKIRIKVDGEEVDLPLEKVVQGYRKAVASDKRFEEAAEMRREAVQEVEEANSRFERLRTISQRLVDPETMADQFERMGMKDAFEKAVIAYVERKNFELTATPEQLRAAETERRLREYERREAMTKQQREEAEKKARQERVVSQFTKDFEESVSGLGVSLESKYLPRLRKEVVARVNEVSRAERRALRAEDLARIVEAEYNDLKPLFDAEAAAAKPAEPPPPKEAAPGKPKPPPRAGQAKPKLDPKKEAKREARNAKRRRSRLSLSEYFEKLERGEAV